MIRIGELFSGAGGFAIGADIASKKTGLPVKHVWAVDYNAAACATYKHNFPRCRVICEDARTVDYSALPKVHGLTFGFPCNSFSDVGRKQGMECDRYGELYLECTRALKECQPEWFIAENVRGLLTADKGRAFNVIRASFESAGYRVRAKVIFMEEHGVPQRRARLIFVGIRKDLTAKFKWPKPKSEFVPLRQAFRKIAKDDPMHNKHWPTAEIQEVLAAIAPGSNYGESLDAIPQTHRPSLRAKGQSIYSTYYRRLSWDLPAYTVLAEGGGGQKQHHPKELRPLTNREMARIQTFPDSHVFVGSAKEVKEQIGMAVPPKGISRIYISTWRALGLL